MCQGGTQAWLGFNISLFQTTGMQTPIGVLFKVSLEAGYLDQTKYVQILAQELSS